MPLPTRKSLPSLDDLEIVDNFDKSLIEYEDLEELTDDSFDNAYSDDYDDIFSKDYSEEEINHILEEADDFENPYLNQGEESDNFEDEDDIEEIKPKKVKNNKKIKLDILNKIPKPDLKNTKQLVIFSVGGAVIFLILLFLISMLFNRGETNKNVNSKDSISITSITPSSVFATVLTTSDTPGFVQILYKTEKNKTILCESAENDFSQKEKEVEVFCFNTGSEDLNKLEKIESKLIKSNYN